MCAVQLSVMGYEKRRVVISNADTKAFLFIQYPCCNNIYGIFSYYIFVSSGIIVAYLYSYISIILRQSISCSGIIVQEKVLMTNRDQKLPGESNYPKGISSFVSQEDEKFSFAAYADRFDEHINRSIRGYSQLRDDTVAMSRYFVENETMVLDVGCSQGTLLKRIKATNTQAPKACYVGIDIEPSFEKYWHVEEGLSYECADIRNWTGSMPLSLAVSLFTLQFIPRA